MRERERGGMQAPERARVGTFWCSRQGGVPEHQNEPVWARSGVRDEGEGEGRCASTRTSPCGLVLVFETRERERGGARAPERATHGLILVFEMRGRERRGAQAPERARAGTFWCL